MSRLSRLLARLCPNGVEYKRFDEVVETVTPTIKIKRLDYAEYGKMPIVSQEEELISGYSDKVDPRIGPGEYICFGDHSEHLKFIDFAFVQGADGLKIMKVNKSRALAKYVYYAAQNYYRRHDNYERHFKYLEDTLIPLPPLEIQREVVEILDKFAQLTAELTAELAKRKKQYSHYRDKLLTGAGEGVEWKRLGEIAMIGTGSSNRNEASPSGQYPFFVRSKQVERMDHYEFDEEAIIIPGEGGIGDIFHHINGKYALHQRVYRIHLCCDCISHRFVYHYFSAKFKKFILGKAVTATVTSIRKPMIESFQIPLPPLAEQKRIVAILDRFDALCNSLSEGLPAEIELRRKQYEYYRDKLLSFKEAS